jgi:hypothetical protein
MFVFVDLLYTGVHYNKNRNVHLTEHNNKSQIKPRRGGRRRLAGWSGYYLCTCRRARFAVSNRSRVYE